MTPTEAAEKFGEQGCTSCGGTAHQNANIEDIVAEVTKRVLEKYNK